MSNKELKIIAVVLFLLFIYMLFIAENLKTNYNSLKQFDYHIEINESGETRIKTEEKDTVIQFNCLENYIKNDNI